VRIADKIGYPVMIKASAGGGGKGMRIAYRAGEVEEGFARARSEAKSAFGDDRVFVEKFIVDPRHVEIQVLGDKHGNVIHLGERECSIQRRNQKVLEEAPSPLLDAKTRAAMGAQAVALAKAVGYDSAGTVEFVAGQDRSFYFLEMNTRLQVEHPVTEMVTGIDLVEEMIRIAAGERLRLTQDAVRLDGWAVESRVYAEDPTRNFLPSIGRLTVYRPPPEQALGKGRVRIDTGVREGSAISIHYDPMIAKLVTHAATRADAIETQSLALDAFALEGIRHNLPFLSAVMHHPRWREGRLSTGFIAEEFPQGFALTPPQGERAREVAAVAIAVDHALNRRKQQVSGRMRHWRFAEFAAERLVRIGDVDHVATIAEAGDGTVVAFLAPSPAKVTLSSAWRPGEPSWLGTIEGRPAAMQLRPIANGFIITHAGTRVSARVYTRREAELAAMMPKAKAAGVGTALTCPMPGLVKAIFVKTGQEVKGGDMLCIVEAMKMENVLRAERDAKVAAIRVKEGDTLAVDAVIMEFA
jgi:propionyl-CoA carboxylase alpha chain